MLIWAMLLMLASCGKRSLIKTARMEFIEGIQCLDTLRARMQDAGCDSMQVEHRGNPLKGEAEEILFRCYKDEKDRGKFWDNYIFRMTYSNLQWEEEALKEIEDHTICIDKVVRIEAYAP